VTVVHFSVSSFWYIKLYIFARLVKCSSDHCLLLANNCPPHYTPFSGDAYCYRLSATVRSRSDAERDCNSAAGGHLVEPDGTAEHFEDIVRIAMLAVDDVTRQSADFLWIGQQEGK